MKRTLIQFDEDTYRKLRQRAKQFLSVRAGRSKQDRLSLVSENHDQSLADAFKK